MAKQTTQELIAVLEKAAEPEDVIRAGLVVGFEERTETVWAADAEPLRDLEAHVRAGGLPVGVIRFDREGVEVTPLAEYRGEEWAEKYLATIVGEVTRGLLRHLGVDEADIASSPRDALLQQLRKNAPPPS